jgi:L-rhamnose mutarotase
MPRYVLALDLIDEEKLIEEYEAHHRAVWPEVLSSIRGSGIESMHIYRVSNRLVMIMETSEVFSFAAKARSDADNARVQEWEELMWQYQKQLPGSKEGEKWRVMEQIFKL